MEPARELFLVVTLDLRLLFRQQPPQPDCRRRFAVGEVMDDLPDRPLVRCRPGVELFGSDLQQRFGNRRIAVLVLRDQLLPFFSVHTSPNSDPTHSVVIRIARQYIRYGSRSRRNACSSSAHEATTASALSPRSIAVRSRSEP